MDFGIRPMAAEDIPQVAEIEREAFPTTWPPTPFKRDLGNKMARYLVVWSQWDGRAQSSADSIPLEIPKPWMQRVFDGVRGLLGAPPELLHEDGDLIAGYVGLWFAVDEAHIVSIAVREAYRGLGLGELLLMGAIELAMARRAQRVALEARITNSPAHALYEKYGFERVGVRKRYYSDNHEDAVLMNAEAILSPAYQEMFRNCVDAFHQRRGEAVRTLA